MTIKSKALTENLMEHQVLVSIDPKYLPLQAVLSKYYGIMEGANNFLTELSHPYRNWQFIVQESRSYALDYFHLFVSHPLGPEAATLFVDIYFEALAKSAQEAVREDACNHLLLFLQKMIRSAGENFPRFKPVLDAAFERISHQPENAFFLFVRGYYQIKRLAEAYLAASQRSPQGYAAINTLLARYYRQTYAYWRAEEDPGNWFSRRRNDSEGLTAREAFFKPVSHERLAAAQRRLAAIEKQAEAPTLQRLEQLLTLPSFGQIVEAYRRIPGHLAALGQQSGKGNQWKAIFLFHIMNISGLAVIHEEALREINRTLSWLIAHEPYRNVRLLIENTFAILKSRADQFPTTALSCVQNMGMGVYKTDERDLVNVFIDEIIDLGFQVPRIGGVGDDWQIKSNSAHLLNIRAWLELIKLNPRWSLRLLSGLIIHLAVAGVLIKDTDLFFRDITELLNSRIDPVYNQIKQLMRLLPVFFNDIGAEGDLRDISTEIDELTQRKDILIHFLRKQSHVESSNRTLSLIMGVIEFWRTGEKAPLAAMVPPRVFEQIRTRGRYIDGVRRALRHMESQGIHLPDDLLTREAAQIEALLGQAEGVGVQDARRVVLLATFYKLLDQKYSLGFARLNAYVDQLKPEVSIHLGRLKKALKISDTRPRLVAMLEYLELLKEMILSEEHFEVREDIYKKRHFAIDIPSMYGSYHERKFDAMGLMLRLESQVNVLFETLVAEIDLKLITRATFYDIHAVLSLFARALRCDGMPVVEFERLLSFLYHSLQVTGFTFTQYLDIFKGFARAVRNIINDCFHNIHEQNLAKILATLPRSEWLPKYQDFGPQRSDDEKARHRVSEIFFRDRIAATLGLQQLDQFLTRILNTLYHQFQELPRAKSRELLRYDHQRAVAPLNKVDARIPGIIHLGNKGYNLVKLLENDIPVPPGFIITTEVFKYREIIKAYPPALEDLKAQMLHHIKGLEGKLNKRFGDPEHPLLFSVRSGASISQPGMMDTFLNVGMNEQIARGLAAQTRNVWFAWDNYRRYLQCYGMSLGMTRDHFDSIIRGYKGQLKIPLKRFMTGEQMQTLALKYKESIEAAGHKVLEEPLDQLFMAIECVFDSWYSAKANTYRRIMDISDDWGTAVTVQHMVYGNLSRQSGSGVVMTHNPRWAGDTLRLWGDFTIGNQGEDVVAGLVSTLPISITQQEIEMRDTDITLETHFPEIYEALRQWAILLTEHQGWSPQEIEFTFEGPKASQLYVLQCRDMSVREHKIARRFPEGALKIENFLGNGVGVSGGAMSGRAVFELKEIERWHQAEPDTDLILLRNDTVPDDIREIYAADGLLTARGGMTSHAAVVANRLGKTCVVGCDNLFCDEDRHWCTLGDQKIQSGDFISIDGYGGAVYRGRVAVDGD